MPSNWKQKLNWRAGRGVKSGTAKKKKVYLKRIRIDEPKTGTWGGKWWGCRAVRKGVGSPRNGALSGQRDRDKKVAFQNGKMLR